MIADPFERMTGLCSPLAPATVGGRRRVRQTLPSVVLPEEPRIEVASRTNIRHSRSGDADAYLIGTLRQATNIMEASEAHGCHEWIYGSSSGTLRVLAHGAGDQADGPPARGSSIEMIADYVFNLIPWVTAHSNVPGAQNPSARVRNQLAMAISEDSRSARRERLERGASDTISPTLTLAYAIWPVLYVAYTGDSRCYTCGPSGLTRITADPTFPAPWRRRVPAPRRRHDDVSAVLQRALSTALGGPATFSSGPHLLKLTLSAEDTILVCSDGLMNRVSPAEIAAHVRTSGSCAELCGNLVKRAGDASGGENVTAITARFA